MGEVPDKERLNDGETAPSAADLAHDLDVSPKREFTHWIHATDATSAICGEVPKGGFRIVAEDVFLHHPCPDCLRRWRAQRSRGST